MESRELEGLVGAEIVCIEGLCEDSTEVKIILSDGGVVTFNHEQDCCEQVWLEDFENDILHPMMSTTNAVILSAEEVTEDKSDDPVEGHMYGDDSATWTFYKIETTEGGLWMRWLGESNGYYSESVTVRHNKGTKII